MSIALFYKRRCDKTYIVMLLNITTRLIVLKYSWSTCTHKQYRYLIKNISNFNPNKLTDISGETFYLHRFSIKLIAKTSMHEKSDWKGHCLEREEDFSFTNSVTYSLS